MSKFAVSYLWREVCFSYEKDKWKDDHSFWAIVVEWENPPPMLSVHAWYRAVKILHLSPVYVHTAPFQVLFGTDTDRARWRTCVNYAIDNFGMAVGRIFVQKYFNEEAKTSVSRSLVILFVLWLFERVQSYSIRHVSAGKKIETCRKMSSAMNVFPYDVLDIVHFVFEVSF